ncbi:MAG: hypothetical protein IPK21_12795 [Haliscomenobacter sp.]|nr:hypothetical protein [Haliscomenobacter sp.]
MTRYPATALLLLALLGVFSAGRTAMMWWYHLERSSFEKQFCENIDTPELECHESCHIKALFQDREPASEMAPPSRIPLPELSAIEIHELTPVLIFADWTEKERQNAFGSQEPIPSGFLFRLLRPPDVA